MASNHPPLNHWFRIRKATLDDVESVVQIYLDAFGPSVMSRLMYPDGVNPTIRSKLAASFRSACNTIDSPFDVDGGKPPPAERVLMVAELLSEPASVLEYGSDGSRGKLIAYSKWEIIREPRAECEWKSPVRPETAEAVGEGVDLEVFNEFMGGMHNMRNGWVKRGPALSELIDTFS